MPSEVRELRMMLWSLIWETLSNQFDDGLPTGRGDEFSYMDLQSSSRGDLCQKLEDELYET